VPRDRAPWFGQARYDINQFPYVLPTGAHDVYAQQARQVQDSFWLTH
jgi:hypothetical protein